MNYYSGFPQQQLQQTGSIALPPHLLFSRPPVISVGNNNSNNPPSVSHPLHGQRYDTCPICLEESCRLELFCCQHGVCSECRDRLTRGAIAPRCPLCRVDISSCLQQPSVSIHPPLSLRSIVREVQLLREEIRLLRQAKST